MGEDNKRSNAKTSAYLPLASWGEQQFTVIFLSMSRVHTAVRMLSNSYLFARPLKGVRKALISAVRTSVHVIFTISILQSRESINDTIV